jgi:hypothetical protein
MLLKHKFLEICIDLKSTVAAAHPAEGQGLEERLNIEYS